MPYTSRSWCPSLHLKDFMTLAEDLPVAGFSVTIPHKQKILRYLDAVDPVARRIGAVNTVWRKAGRWRGLNADAEAVVNPLSRHLRLAKSSVLLVGNGGAARSAAFALADAGSSLSIVGRNPDRVRALAKACGAEPLLREQLPKLHFDAVVHATSLGMHPHTGECFFEDRIPADVVFDMVYNPAETLLHRSGPGSSARRSIPGSADVPGTGGPAVRDLDGRERSPRGDGAGGPRGPGVGRLFRLSTR